MMRVVIAEDAVVLREGLTRLIEDHGHEVCAAVADGDALLAAVAEHKPDVAVIDIRMPPTHTDEGLRAALQLRQDHRDTGVMMFSQYVETRYAVPAAGRQRGRGRLPAQGPGGRRGRLRGRAGAGGRRWHRPGPRGGQPAVPGQPPDRGPVHADPTRTRRAGPDGRGPLERRHQRRVVHLRRRGGKARGQHLRQAGPAPVRRRQPPGAGRAALPGRHAQPGVGPGATSGRACARPGARPRQSATGKPRGHRHGHPRGPAAVAGRRAASAGGTPARPARAASPRRPADPRAASGRRPARPPPRPRRWCC